MGQWFLILSSISFCFFIAVFVPIKQARKDIDRVKQNKEDFQSLIMHTDRLEGFLNLRYWTGLVSIIGFIYFLIIFFNKYKIFF